MPDERWYTMSVGLNFLDHPPRVPRTIFVEPEEAPALKTGKAAARAEAPNEADDAQVTTVLFRTLKRFPEAYRAVVEALRQL
jgi:hypothetical protein